MKGHLRERSPGHWAIVIDVRSPASAAQMASASRREVRCSNEERRSNRRRFLTAGTTSVRWAQIAVITGERIRGA
jgi:hypothetical protein